MMNDMRRYQKAYNQGFEDAQNGILFRLELAEDDKEYQFYAKGQKDGRVNKQIEPTKIEEVDNEPLPEIEL